jgi:Lon protease-like protein
VQRADLLQRVRERVVSDVVKERRRPDDRLLLLTDGGCVFRLAKEREGAPREVVGAELVLETRLCSAWIN